MTPEAHPSHEQAVEPGGASAPTGGASRGHGWSRHAFVAGWVIAFALLGGAVTSSWDRLLGVLARTPSPALALAPPSTGPSPAAGERALAEARVLLDQGDAARALVVLERVRPEEPAYPLARRLRDQAEGALRASSPSRSRAAGAVP